MLNKDDIAQIKGFYQLPKFLFKKEKYKKMSTEAKTMYALFIDRMKLSIKNNWLDKDDNVYIIFTNEEVRQELNCCIATAVKVVKELKKYGLILTKRQGLGKPNLIYLQKVEEFLEKISSTKTSKNKSKDTVINNSIINNTNGNTKSIDNSIIDNNINKSSEQEQELKAYEEVLKEQIDYESLVSIKPTYKSQIDELLEIMLEVLLSKKETIKISKNNDVSTALFKSKIFKINSLDIEYIIDCLNKNNSKIINIKNYLLSTIFNVKTTLSNYYSNLVQSDMYGYGGV